MRAVGGPAPADRRSRRRPSSRRPCPSPLPPVSPAAHAERARGLAARPRRTATPAATRPSSKECSSECSRKRLAVAASGSTQPRAASTRAVSAPSAPASNCIGPRLPPGPAPAETPRCRRPRGRSPPLPSDRGVTVSVHFPPSSTLKAVTDPSAPVMSDFSGQGGSPARRASPCRADVAADDAQAVLDRVGDAAGDVGGAHRRRGDEEQRRHEGDGGDVLECRLTGGGMRSHTPHRRGARKLSPWRLEQRLDRAAGVLGDVEQRLGVDAEARSSPARTRRRRRRPRAGAACAAPARRCRSRTR